MNVLLGYGGATTRNVTTNCFQSLTGIDLTTQEDALFSQGQIAGYQNGLSVVSGAIGAVLSCFQVAVQLTMVMADSYMDAEARITDVDVATDVADLVRKQIVQQAATAMLAQANQQPALALKLFQTPT